MKQHITLEQLNELSDRGKSALVGAYPIDKIHYQPYPEFLTIGQMLEYLAEYEPDHLHGLSRDGQGIFSVVGDSADERFTANACLAGDPHGGSAITHIRYREGTQLADTFWFVVGTILEHDPKI